MSSKLATCFTLASVWCITWFVSGYAHERDLVRQCREDGAAVGYTGPIQCGEMKRPSH